MRTSASRILLSAIVLVPPAPAAASAMPGQGECESPSPFGGDISSGPSRPAPTGFLGAAISREAARAASERVVRASNGTSSVRQQSSQTHRSWIGRHPVWFGTIVGAVSGTAVAAAVWGSEGSFVGFYGGAALGAITGVVVAAAR